MANQVTRWQPFGNALSLRDAMDQLFEDSFISPSRFMDSWKNALGSLALEMYETPDDIVINAVVPGVKSEDLNIQVQEERLILDVNLPATKMENVVWHYRELPAGQYHREISLPTPVNSDKVEATLTNGVLTLRLPKAEAVKPKKIQIKSNVK